MWIGYTYVKTENVVTAEPYVQDRSYGIKINGIPIEIESSESIYSKEKKLDIIEKIVNNYIRDIEK